MDAEGRDYVERLARASERLNGLVHNLLVYARIAYPGAAPILEPVSWDRVVDGVLRDLEPERAATGARVDVDRPLGVVLGHRETLGSVAHNLLANAMKFVAPGTRPEVNISSAKSGNRLRLKVRDNGIGVAPQDQARIFVAFERLHTPAAYAGTGLGLAIVAEAVRRMGGGFGIESDGRQGSCFWVELASAPGERSASVSADSAG
jgi:signal transduction histidine kinase